MTKEKLKELYCLLSDYEMFLARRYLPPDSTADDVVAVREVEEHLEEVIKLQG